MAVTRPVVLVDELVLDGSARAFPLQWLDGCDARPYAPRQLGKAAVAHAAIAQAAIVRSMTRVGRAELAALPALRLIATLSSGTDHLDARALAARSVQLSTGHGGNARAVADWVQWAIDRLAPRAGLRVLVVGLGAVGGIVAERLAAAGNEVLPCDPPLAADARFAGARPWCDLDQALARDPDVVTLHVPLAADGAHPTGGLFDARRLARWARPGRVLLNAARGGILDEAAAARAVAEQRLVLGLDTFGGEPRPAPTTLAACALATPHIAGHSVEGKLDVAHRALSGLRAAFGLPALAPLVDVAAEALSPLPTALVEPFGALDRCATAFAADAGAFERLRHGHLRRERLPLPP
ncbi:MAG: hypothetical protein FJ100_20235 [Deltaproteobacteria bacterium]|nr:hypothetical protein [Deltaproteobacteria bacterium]